MNMRVSKAQKRLCLAERHFIQASGRWVREPNEVTRLAAVVALQAVCEAEHGVCRAKVEPITWLHWCVLGGALYVLLVVLGDV